MSDAPSTNPRSENSAGRALFLILFWSVAVTGAGPYLFAREAMNPALAAIVMGHVAGGLTLLLFLRRLFKAWISWVHSGSGAPAGLLPRFVHVQGASILALLGAVSGGGLIIVALIGQSIGHWRGMYLTHVAAGMSVVILALWQCAGRLISRFRRPFSTSPMAGAALILLSGGALAATSYAADSYFTNLTATTPQQARNPLFPAGAKIVQHSSEWPGMPSPDSCGETGCHPDIVGQWKHSGHARSFENPIYQTILSSARSRLGEDGIRWCAGCHNPLSLANDVTNDVANPKSKIQNPKSIDCLTCHAMSHVPDSTGNGRAAYSPPPLYPFAGGRSASERRLRGFLLRVRPAPHRAGYAGPKDGPSGPAMCAPCHRLSVNVPQNGYKFLRYDDTWSDWQASGYSGESTHAFAPPARTANCVSCHMRPVAGSGPTESEHIHACPQDSSRGASSLPLPGDNGMEMAKSRQKVYPLHVEVFALRRDGRHGGMEQLDAPLEHTPVTLAPGQTVTLDVLVENRDIGHSFPTGVPTMRQAWLELRLGEGGDRPDDPAPQRPNDPTTHSYGLVALNRKGEPIGAEDFYTMVAPVYLRSIPSGEGDVARYRFTIPRVVGGWLRVTAKLMYRPYSEELHRKAGLPPASVLATVLAEHSIELAVAESAGAARHVPDRAGDPRYAPSFFAYGVALLRPDAEPAQLAQARASFQQALRLAPGNPLYLVALGRAYLAEGDLLAARVQIEKALGVDPQSAPAKAWLGTTFLRMGQFEKALAILTPLARAFPRDRLLWQDIGLCYLKSAQYDSASEAFGRVLEVDPDDATAHYNLMRCYTAMNRLTDARREEAIFRALQDDEPLTSIVEPFLQNHPGLRRESLRMHVHELGGGR